MKLKILSNLFKGFFKKILEYLNTILFLTGLIMIAVAGFMFNTIIGLVLSGFFLIIIAFIVDKQNGGER